MSFTNGSVENIACVYSDPRRPPVLLTETDVITHDVEPLGKFVEYRFEKGPWLLSKITESSLADYMDRMLGNFEELMSTETCIAALKRMLSYGSEFRILDKIVFPNPDESSPQWTVREKGATVIVPRPVSALRVWKPS